MTGCENYMSIANNRMKVLISVQAKVVGILLNDRSETISKLNTNTVLDFEIIHDTT